MSPSADSDVPRVSSVTTDKLPEIKLRTPKPVSASTTSLTSPVEKLPTVRSGRRHASQSQPLHSPTREPEDEDAKGKSCVLVDEWKSDPMLNTWLKDVQRRKIDEKAKRVRQAHKDANWIIARRQKQMKDIRERQKAEQREMEQREKEERVLREQEAREAAAQNEARNLVAAASGGIAKFRAAAACVAKLVHLAKLTGVAISFGKVPKAQHEEWSHHSADVRVESLPRNNGPLMWKVPQQRPVPYSRQNKERDVAIWVKPGLFCTKKIAVKPEGENSMIPK
ncbi:hypothetical protein CYMTET_38244 [Cymbomonas tetramitiformis]|uniref:Uncharacterized protein n=2 Tax=Cymbomonas tetramitiformis TaxID=36881 RepID=A0AAE0CE48_9CHLO|nr:hypothetical protein CYMTET_38244 [Cymbomonas tetramitiformis]